MAPSPSSSSSSSSATTSSSGHVYDSTAAFGLLSLLLLLGHATRTLVTPIRALHIPSSVVAGLLGLAAINTLPPIIPGLEEFAHNTRNAWRSWPGILINLIFSAMFLGVRLPSASKVANIAGMQLCYGFFIAFGQWAVALGITLAIVVPIWKTDPLIATTIPVGFAGGHGTAGGLVETYKDLGFNAGSDLGLFTATVGLISALAIGVGAVAYARATGAMPVRASSGDGHGGSDAAAKSSGIIPLDERPIAGRLTVPGEQLDSMSLHAAFVGLAVAFGMALKAVLVALENLSEATKSLGLAASLPLFPMCMLGGVAVQSFVERAFAASPIDRDLMERVSNLSLDYLVAGAVAGLDLATVSSGLAPILVLVFFGLLWNAACLFLFAPRLFVDHKYERGVVEMGQNTGVVATGLLLLRMADPNNITGELQAFTFKQIVHSAFMGGGLWTVTGVVLVHRLGPFQVFVITGCITLACGLLGYLVLVPLAQRSASAASFTDNPMHDDESEGNVRDDQVLLPLSQNLITTRSDSTSTVDEEGS